MENKDRRKLDHLFQIIVSQKHSFVAKATEESLRLWEKNAEYYELPSGELAFLDSLGTEAYRSFLRLMTKDKEISRRFTPTSIDAIVKKYIFKYLEDAAQGHRRDVTTRKVVGDLLQELNSGGEESEVYLLVNGLRLEQCERFQFGRITFQNIDPECAEGLYPNVDFSIAPENKLCQPIPESRQRETDEHRDQERNRLIGKTLVKVIQRGD